MQNKVKKGLGLKSSIKKRRTLFWRPHHTLSQSQKVVLIKFGKKFLSNRRGIKVAFFRVQRPDYWQTARYRLKYCLKGPLNPKQPTKSRYLGEWVQLHICPPFFTQGDNFWDPLFASLPKWSSLLALCIPVDSSTAICRTSPCHIGGVISILSLLFYF